MKRFLFALAPYDFNKKSILKYKLLLEIGLFLTLVSFIFIVSLEHILFIKNINPHSVLSHRYLIFVYLFSILVVVINFISGLVIGIINLVKKRTSIATISLYILNFLVFIFTMVYFGGTR